MSPVRVVAVVLVCALLGVLGLGAPAYAEQKKLKLATTASGPFGDRLPVPLFTGTYVPGGATGSFYVKNSSAQTARTTIALVGKPAANDFERALSFTASVAGAAGTPVPLHQDKKKNECRTLVTGPTIAAGAVQRIDVGMLIADGAPMNQQATFSFVVTLSQVSNTGKVDVCGAQSPGGTATRVTGAGTTQPAPSSSVAPTGGRGVTTVLTAALALVSAGSTLFFVAAARRRRRLAR